MIGNKQDAERAARQWDDPYYYDVDVECIGYGERRCAYLINGVVYKVGHVENRRDHDMLTAAREAGMPWAPETTLYEVESWWDRWAPGYTVPVLAMPHLTPDGSMVDIPALALMQAQTGGVYDYVVVGGQPIVWDGAAIPGANWDELVWDPFPEPGVCRSSRVPDMRWMTAERAAREVGVGVGVIRGLVEAGEVDSHDGWLSLGRIVYVLSRVSV